MAECLGCRSPLVEATITVVVREGKEVRVCRNCGASIPEKTKMESVGGSLLDGAQVREEKDVKDLF